MGVKKEPTFCDVINGCLPRWYQRIFKPFPVTFFKRPLLTLNKKSEMNGNYFGPHALSNAVVLNLFWLAAHFTFK